MNPLAVQETNMTLDEICDEIGYKDVPRFIKNFKEKYEMTPGKFRKESSRVLMPKILTYNGYAGMPPSVFMANRTCAAVPRLSASSSRSNSGE